MAYDIGPFEYVSSGTVVDGSAGAYTLGAQSATVTADHTVSADLSVPKEMGGPGKPGTTTPEHLFAADYAACFGGALDFVATQNYNADRTEARVALGSFHARLGRWFARPEIVRVS